MEPVDGALSGGSSGPNEGSKLPPVLANLMGSLGNSGRSPQAQGSAPPANNNPSVNVQELLSSIMVRQNTHLHFIYHEIVQRLCFLSFSACFQGAQGSNQSPEDLIKQPDFSDKIKQLLGSLQQNQNQNQNPPPNAPPSTCLLSLSYVTVLFVYLYIK